MDAWNIPYYEFAKLHPEKISIVSDKDSKIIFLIAKDEFTEGAVLTLFGIGELLKDCVSLPYDIPDIEFPRYFEEFAGDSVYLMIEKLQVFRYEDIRYVGELLSFLEWDIDSYAIVDVNFKYLIYVHHEDVILFAGSAADYAASLGGRDFRVKK